MGVLKSWTRTSSPLQTMICLIPDGATAGLTSGPDMSTPSEAAPRGGGAQEGVSRGPSIGSSSSPLPGYNERVQLPESKGQLVLF